MIVWLAYKGIFSWIGDVSQLRKNHWPCHRPGSWGLIGVYKVTSTTKLLITTFLLTYVLTFYLALFRAFYLTCILTYSFWHSICDLSGSLSGVRVQACHGVPSCIQSWWRREWHLCWNLETLWIYETFTWQVGNRNIKKNTSTASANHSPTIH